MTGHLCRAIITQARLTNATHVFNSNQEPVCSKSSLRETAFFLPEGLMIFD